MPPKFIKTIGHARAAVPDTWMADRNWNDRLESVVFPKYPRSVVRGSRLVYYAAGRQRFCGVMEVIADEPVEHDDERWPYLLPLRPIVAIPPDDFAPSLSDVGFDSLRVRRQSHVRLTDQEYRHISQAIAVAVAAAVKA
jgi:hypothetical protein